MKPVIELWEGVGLGLIIEWRSGILYSNQTGGTACLHPEVEGVFVPLRNDCERDSERLLSPEKDLLEYFEGPKHRGTGAIRGLDTDDADFITSIFARWHIHELAVDRTRLRDSHEAWVHVVVDGELGGGDGLPLKGFPRDSRKGILTWSNSD
jgi:hypothetical protein